MQPDNSPRPLVSGATPLTRQQAGVSLLEALIALAVMAFGLLGVVGVQTTLRTNGDISRQRAEAVRIAEETIEHWRAFTALDTPSGPSPHTTVYAQLLSAGPTTVAGNSTTYSVSQVVSTIAQPAIKSLQVDVTWPDRSGAQQQVTMTTRIAGVLPELSGSLSISPRSLTGSQIFGRNTVIPTTATNQGSTSNFAPPGAAAGVSWVFNNTTGLISSICSAPGVCAPAGAALLSGYVRYALTSSAPTGVDAEIPPPLPAPAPSWLSTLGVEVETTAPSSAIIACYTQWVSALNATAYYCAIPLPSAPPLTWTGTSRIVPASIPLPTSPTPATDPSATKVRVCRYTSDSTTDAAPGGNVDHPLVYSAVATSLGNQNFLVITGGNGGSVFGCPTDGTGASPFIDGDTRAHQPPN